MCEGEGKEDLQHLNRSQRAQPKLFAQHREVLCEKVGRETELGEDQDDGLADDEEPVEDGPKYASGLVRYCAPTTPKSKSKLIQFKTVREIYRKRTRYNPEPS